MRISRTAWLSHPALLLLVRIGVGAVFVAAALPKISDPPSFAHMIYNYRLLPGPAINLAALWMPWVELLAGLALALGIWRREAAGVIGALLLVFIGAVGWNLLRGHPIDCGCFDVRSAGKTPDQLIRDMRWVILRDMGLLIACSILLVGTSVRTAVRESTS